VQGCVNEVMRESLGRVNKVMRESLGRVNKVFGGLRE